MAARDLPVCAVEFANAESMLFTRLCITLPNDPTVSELVGPYCGSVALRAVPLEDAMPPKSLRAAAG